MTSVTVPCLAVIVLWLNASLVLLALRLTVVFAETTLATASAPTTATTAAIRSLRRDFGHGWLLDRGATSVTEDARPRRFLPRRRSTADLRGVGAARRLSSATSRGSRRETTFETPSSPIDTP